MVAVFKLNTNARLMLRFRKVPLMSVILVCKWLCVFNCQARWQFMLCDSHEKCAWWGNTLPVVSFEKYRGFQAEWSNIALMFRVLRAPGWFTPASRDLTNCYKHATWISMRLSNRISPCWNDCWNRMCQTTKWCAHPRFEPCLALSDALVCQIFEDRRSDAKLQPPLRFLRW